ncbi:hypothetical protein [Algoriphagus hitonicola]|uniref:Uncharacterized protein n=1 Tax=Algoriphagus hitonicola TaxID=435880 RepID=A0A1I2VTC3_9BACT|nr:hypothetical protein [Algoriphagus hitonicola]SFG91709.1 hypothetical protein SAMN04487988_110108 [Algoriphagus hitonicola]
MRVVELISKKASYLKNQLLKSVVFSLLTFVLIFVNVISNAQESENRQLSGTITATNNGISIIPSFSLGRPAVFFDLSMGGKRLSFDPMLRFGMDGKPWTFIFWGRYKVIKDKRFSLTIGGHPAFLFMEKEMLVDGNQERAFVANRYLAGEVNTSYKVTNKFSLGFYYLRGSGVQVIAAKNSDFFALNAGISDVKLVNDLSLSINPQVFFLQVDENSGNYVNSAFTFKKGHCLFSFRLFSIKKSNPPSREMTWFGM